MSGFKQHIEDHGVQHVTCIGTAIFRTAVNGVKFVQKVKEELGFQIDVIDGQREAELIFKGVALSGFDEGDASLILDVGGGSVEFILVQNEKLKKSWSKYVGISVLKKLGNKEDPLSKEDVKLVFSFLDDHLSDMIFELKNSGVSELIGAAGPFEIFESMSGLDPYSNGNRLSKEEVQKMCKTILEASLSQREKIPGIPKNRVLLSAESSLLIKYLLIRLASICSIKISPYTMKEGIISEYYNLD